jgi:uncharacterized protein (TIGR04141 family)
VQVTMYLLRKDLPRNDWGCREVISEFVEIPTCQIDSLRIRLFVRQSHSYAPRWLRDLVCVTATGSISGLVNTHSAAILQVQHGGYRFVITWGTGRLAIDRAAVQPRFGLIVAANAMTGRTVKSADTRELGGRSKSQRIVMPSAGPLYELGIEPMKELVQLLEGRPDSVDFAHAVAGSDSLKLNLRNFSLSQLQGKLDQIVERYESTDYKQDFEFLDNFTAVDDDSIRHRLNQAVEELIVGHGSDVDFAAPDITEPLEVEYYQLRFGRKRSKELPDLSPDDVGSTLADWQVEDPLHNVKVTAFDSAGQQVGDSRRLLDYVIAEVNDQDQRYVLCVGRWFMVDDNFVEQVQRHIESIPDPR